MVTGYDEGKRTATKVVQLVDLEAMTYPIGHSENRDEEREWCYARTPYDLPAYFRVMRLLTENRPGRKALSIDHRGWTMEIDLFTFGVKVWIRVGRDGTLRILLGDEEGRETVAEYEQGEDE